MNLGAGIKIPVVDKSSFGGVTINGTDTVLFYISTASYHIYS